MKAVLILITCACCFSGVAQNQYDSLVDITETGSVPLDIVQAHNELAWLYRTRDVSRANYHARQALKISKDNKLLREIATANSRLGTVAKYAGKNDSSIYYQELALEQRREFGDSLEVARSLTSLSSAYKATDHFNKAIWLERKALSIREQFERSDVAKSYNNLGLLYLSKGKIDSALNWFSVGLDHADGDDDMLARLYGNMGVCFYELDSVDAAFKYIELGLTYEILTGNENAIIQSISNLASIHVGEGLARNGVRVLLAQLEKAMENEFGRAIPMIHYQLGQAYNALNKMDSATWNYLEARRMGAWEDPDLDHEISKELLLIYASSGNSDAALKETMRFDSLSSFLFHESTAKALAESEKKYETIKLKAQTKSQKAQLMENRMNFMIVGLTLLALLFIVASVAYYQRQKALIASKNERIKQQEVDELIQKQELASVNAMIEGQEIERKRIAQDLHDRIGSQLSTLKHGMESLEEKVEKGQKEGKEQFQSTYGMIDHLVEEVRKISHNMISGVLMKFGLEAAIRDLSQTVMSTGQIAVVCAFHNLDERIDGRIELAVYRIIQELVANVLKHARADELTLSFNRQNGTLNVVVEDNGVGFDPKKASGGGMGLRNIDERINALQGTYSIDSQINRGTIVIIDIPLI